jgi:hypothetical protein
MSRWIAVAHVGSHLVEAGFWAAIGIALLHRDWPLACLIAGGYSLGTWEDIQFPTEIGLWVLGAGLVRAHLDGELAVFLLAAQVVIPRSVLMLLQLQHPCPAEEWEEFYGGTRPPRFWRALVAAWEGCGSRTRRLGWAIAVAEGIAWPAGLLWLAYDWHSRWAWPYVAACSVLLLWWVKLGAERALRAVMRRPYPYEPLAGHPVGPEATGSPKGWPVEADRMTVRFEHAESRLPPAVLDFAAGFDGPADPRLRLFAADCADNLLPRGGSDDRKLRVNILLTVYQARKRAMGQLHGRPLKFAFVTAEGNLRASARGIARKRGDGARLRLNDDAASAAYHALCAPTPLEAASLAAHCASITVSGELRDDEHRWQLKRLARYRAQGADGT